MIEFQTEPFVINAGPQHPSTHGVFRMRLVLDGEVIQDVEPVFGYLHRGLEKLAEGLTYTQNIVLTDRIDYLTSMSNNQAYVMAVEKLVNVKVPEKAEYIRVIMAELTRIASHLMAVGFLLNDMGAFMTPLLYMFREREKILDLFEMVSGQRLTYNYMRIGGLSQDLPEEFIPALQKFIDSLPGFIDEYDQLLVNNEILLSRTKNIGVLTRKSAINNSTAGPVLRGSGVNWDIRKADPYSVYDRFAFNVPVGSVGDVYDRYRVRIHEMRESAGIIQQAIKNFPAAGEIQVTVSKNLRPEKGEAYGHVEGPKGELGFYLVSDNSIHPYRLHIRPPSFLNLTVLRELIIGVKIADAAVIFGSIDICMGEVDR